MLRRFWKPAMISISDGAFKRQDLVNFAWGFQLPQYIVPNWAMNRTLGGGNSNIFCFHPENWGDDPIWRASFSNGLVQPPTRQGAGFFLDCSLSETCSCCENHHVSVEKASDLWRDSSWLHGLAFVGLRRCIVVEEASYCERCTPLPHLW